MHRTAAISSGRRRLLLVVAGFWMLAVATSCDEARFEEAPTEERPSTYQPRALHTVIGEAGLQALYEAQHPDGARLADRARTVDLFGDDITLGPLDETLPVRRWSVGTSEDSVEVSLETQATVTTIPVRVGHGANARICRYAVETERVEAHSETAAGKVDGFPVFEVLDLPNAELQDPSVSRIGPCAALEEAEAERPDDVDQMLIDYLTNAWIRSIARMSEFSLLEALGFIDEPARLRRRSNFSNRQGSLILASRIENDEDAYHLEDGLRLDLAAAVTGRRAECTPPQSLDPPGSGGAGRIELSALDDAHVGLSLAEPFLARVLQAGTVSGFACRGLEDVSFEGGPSNLAADELNLEEIGLLEVPVGSWIEPVAIPGSVPNLETNAADDALQLNWDALSIDLYAKVQQVPVRIAQLTADVDFAMRPVEHPGGIELSLASLEVSNASVESHWLAERRVDEDVTDWARRVLLLVIEDTVALPLPFTPQTPLELVDSQVRSGDLMLTFTIY